jgi:hypothetical protein
MNQASYTSYLVRLWRAELTDDGWQGQIEHIQSGICQEFDSLAAALHFLQQATELMLLKHAETTNKHAGSAETTRADQRAGP